MTAAAGCAAYSGIPLTHRDHAQALTFVTGHCKGETSNVDWDLVSRPNQTAVFYMGLNHLGAIVANLRAWRACRVRRPSSSKAQAEQRVITAPLAELEQRVKDAGVQSPALLIVGEVTRLHETLRWFNQQGAGAASFSTC